MWCNSSCQVTHCQALTETAELCDKCDNDQNGVVDNAPGSTSPDSLTMLGNPACTTPGTRKCANGVWSAPSGCGGGVPCNTGTCHYNDGLQACDSACNVAAACLADEKCDGCDNDKDGEADEGLQCPQCDL